MKHGRLADARRPLCVARLVTPIALMLFVTLPCATRLRAQERVVGGRSAGAAMSFDAVSFAGAGLSQSTFNGLDSTRIKSVRQFTLPVTAAMPIGDRWRIDLTTLYSTGSVTYTDASAAGGTRTATLSGVSDIRLRATGRVLRDGLIVTVGLNAPTGRTSLGIGEFSALRILSAPALGLGSAPVGSGPSGTLGVVLPKTLGEWAMAFGASYEVRGRYQPIAALSAGSASADFTPGGVVRASMSADRTIGPNRLSLAMAADVFAEDKLKSELAAGATSTTGSGGSQSVATVKLGPVFSADVQMQFAVPRVREFLAYTAYRWRAPFARDGITIDGSSGQYLESGVRAAVPLAAGRDLVLSTDARWHSGLGIDLGLPTSGVVSASASVGVNVRRGLLSLQPYVRVQGGSLTQRTPTVNKPSQAFTGAAAGLVFSSRF
jgi:hypothetical protein